ncbi:MAG: hypothetical protein EPN57_17245 [Paraburkholderia sp.]|nr:MAG: hypothetical protein EPN57_17245 [Paraburkholderia sp.]
MRERQALIMGIQRLLGTASFFLMQIENGSLYRSSLALSTDMTVNDIYVATIKRSAQEIYDFFHALTLEKLAEIDLIDAVLYARQGMKELLGGVSYYEFQEGKPVNQSFAQFRMVKNLIDRSLEEMEMNDRSILDAAKGELPIPQ